MKGQTTQSIADAVAGELLGPGDIAITGLNELAAAKAGQLTFVGTQKYVEPWHRSHASAALVTRGIDIEPGDGRALILVDDADLAMARVLELFAPPPIQPEPGIAPSAVIDSSAILSEDVCIGPGCVVGAHVAIGQRTILHANVTIMDHTTIGDECVLYPGAVIRERCTLGDRCILHPNVTIGADGFGYRPAQGPDGPYLQKIPQIGTVHIESDVEIGAGSCIDRGKFDQTFIGRGTKIDNLVQIGHNCRLGRMVVLAGCVGVAGSVTIGDGTVIGGGAIIRDHLTLGKGVQITGGAQVAQDVPDGEAWGGMPARPVREAMREVMALRKLPDLVKQLRQR